MLLLGHVSGQSGFREKAITKEKLRIYLVEDGPFRWRRAMLIELTLVFPQKNSMAH
jgi:hypothetical protein